MQVKHRNGSLYTILSVGRLEKELIPVVIYQSTANDRVWVRPLHEFLDGRFVLQRSLPKTLVRGEPDLLGLLNDKLPAE